MKCEGWWLKKRRFTVKHEKFNWRKIIVEEFFPATNPPSPLIALPSAVFIVNVIWRAFILLRRHYRCIKSRTISHHSSYRANIANKLFAYAIGIWKRYNLMLFHRPYEYFFFFFVSPAPHARTTSNIRVQCWTHHT